MVNMGDTVVLVTAVGEKQDVAGLSQGVLLADKDKPLGCGAAASDAIRSVQGAKKKGGAPRTAPTRI